MSSLVHKFEKQVLRTDKSGFNSVDNYTIQISSTADDSLYDLYNSYLELTVEMDVSSTTVAISGNEIKLQPVVQPSGMVKVSNVEYQYVDTNNQVQTFTVADQSQYVPNARAVVSMLLDSKSLHNQYAGLTEWKYNTDVTTTTNNKLWDTTVPITIDASNHGTYKIKLPFRDIIPACNGPSFINLKSLKIDLSWIEPTEFFATDANNVFYDTKTKGSFNCKNWSITRCECTTSIYLGNISQIDPSLRGLQNTVIKHDIIKMKSGDTEYCNGISVPFKTSYLILYMTNNKGNHCEPLRKYIKELRCYLSGCVESYKTNSDVSNNKDDYWYYILSHCVAEGREYEPLINYENWKERYNFIVLPLNEMCPQAAANYWNFQLQLHNAVGATGEQLHLLWLKEGEEEVNN